MKIFHTKLIVIKAITAIALLLLYPVSLLHGQVIAPDASRCGSGPVVLHAEIISGTGTLKWYDLPFYGVAFPAGSGEGTVSADGTTFTTPSLVATKTFYVDFVDGSNCSILEGKVRRVVVASISSGSIQTSIFYASNSFCKSVMGTQAVTRHGTAGGTYTYIVKGVPENVYPASSGPLSVDANGSITPGSSTNGNYVVKYSVTASAGCTENPATVEVGITNSTQVPTFRYHDSPYCTSLGGTITVQDTANIHGGIYSASPVGLTLNTDNGTITPSTSAAGNYRITYITPGTGGCHPQTHTEDVIITALPIPVINYFGAPFCNTINTSQPVSLSGTGAYTGGTYSYTGPGTITLASNGGITPNSASVDGTYMIKYLLAAASGCSVVEVTRDIFILELPTATIEAPVPVVCQGATNPVITFTGKNQDGTAGTAFPYTFTYRVNGGAEQTITSAAGSATVNVEQSSVSSGSFAYTLLNISNVNGCTQAVSGSPGVTISINSSRVADFSYTNSSYCANSPDPMPSYSHGGVAGRFTSNPALSTSILDEHTGAIDLSEITPGTFDIINTISAGSGCAEVQGHASITIAKLPDATFHYASATYCTSGTDPDPIFNDGGATDGFTVVPAGLSIHATTGAIDLSLSLEGIYTITRTIPAESGCQQVIATTIVEIAAAPTQSTIDYSYLNSYTGNGYNYCNILPNAFVHLSGTSGGDYTILPATGLAINAGSGTLTTLGATTGSYTVTYTIPAVGGCGALTATAPVTVSEGPTIEAGGMQDVCSGSMVNLAGIRGGSATESTWTSSGNGTFGDETALITTYTPGSNDISAGRISLFLTTNAPGICHAVIDSLFVTINPKATVEAGPNQFVCVSAPSTTLAGSIGGSATSATWTGGLGTYDPNNTTLNAVYSPSTAEILAGTVTLTLTTDDPPTVCDAVSDQLTITIDPVSVGGTISGSTTVCAGSNSTTLTLNDQVGEVEKWQYSSVASFTSDVHDVANTTTSLTATGLTATTYYRAMVQRGSGICANAFSTVATVTVVALPTLGDAPLATQTLCMKGTPTNLTAAASGGAGSFTYQWYSNSSASTSGAAIVTGATSATCIPSTTTAGTLYYYCIISQDGVGCGTLNSGYATVIINALPAVGLTLGGTGLICSGTGANITVALSVEGNNYQLRNGLTNVGEPVEGTGGLLNLPTGNLTEGTTFNVFATLGSCAFQMSATPTITISSLPAPTFTAQPGAAACLETNETYSTQSGQSDYVWTFTGLQDMDYSITSGSGTNSVMLKWKTVGEKAVTANYKNTDGCTIVTTASSITTNVTDCGAPAIGETYQGGKVAYILQTGDPDYVSGEVHGLIAALNNQGTNPVWGCSGTSIAGAQGIILGTGQANTLAIVARCATVSIAAKLINGININGFADWYLPSKNELNKLYVTKASMGVSFYTNDYYWSSSEDSGANKTIAAWTQNFNTGTAALQPKSETHHFVRAIRKF